MWPDHWIEGFNCAMIPGLILTWHPSGSPPARGRLAPRPALGSVGELSVKGHLDALDLVTQFDGGAQFQVHALLHGGQREQKQRLTVDVLQPRHPFGLTETCRRVVVCVCVCTCSWKMLASDAQSVELMKWTTSSTLHSRGFLSNTSWPSSSTLEATQPNPDQISIFAYSDQLAQRRRLFTCMSGSLGGWYWLPWL